MEMTIDEQWDFLIEEGVFTEDEMALVTDGWGHSKNTLETALYARTGYDSFESYYSSEVDGE